MILKDTFNLIKQTKRRFITIVAIVLIGVAFMMGLTSTSSIMQKSVDVYNKNSNLHDFQIYSNYGFCEEDIEEINKLDYVDNVYPSKQIDSYCEINNGEKIVSRIRELDTDINKLVLIEGRLPIKDNEVVIIIPRDYKLNIGDKIRVFKDDGNIDESLKINEFSVVGIGESSEYMTKFLSSSNYKNLDLNVIIYANNDIFISDYYTCVYLTIKDSKDYLTGSEEYFDYINTIKSKIESFKDIQEPYNKNKIINKANKEIDDAIVELEDARSKGQKELNDAYKKLKDAWQEILDGTVEIDDGIEKLDDAQEEVDNGYDELNSNKQLIYSNKKQVVDSLSQNPAYIGMSFDEIYNSIEQSINTYNSLIDNKNTLQPYVDEILLQFPNGTVDIDNYIDILSPETPGYEQIINSLNQSKDVLNNYNQIKQSIDTYFSEENVIALQTYYPKLKELKEAETKLIVGEKQLEDAQETIENGRIEIEDAKAKLEDGKKEYYKGKKEYEDALIEFNDKIADAEEEIEEAKRDLKDLEEAKWTILDRQLHYTSYMYKNTCSQMRSIGIVMPILFFLVAALVCMTTMTRLVDEQRGQNGIYSALGYSKKYITLKYILYVFIASILGEIPGIVIGMAVFPTVIYLTWRLLYQLPEICMFIPLISLIVSICSFSVLMMVVTYFVLKESLNEKPAQLMRPKSPKLAEAVFLEKIDIIWNKLSFTSKITARNLIRYKSRFFMTVIGVAGCTGLLVLGWGIKDSIGDIVNIQYGKIFNYDYTISLENDDNLDNIIKEINNLEKTNVVIPHMSYMSKVKFSDNSDATINAIIIDKNDYCKIFNLQDFETNKKLQLNNDGVIITKKFAENNNLKVGDYINIESKNGHSQKLRIDNIALVYFQHYVFISEDLYTKTFNEDIIYNNIALKCSNEINQLLKLPTRFNNVNAIEDFTSFTNQFNVMIEALDLIIAVIIITAGALAFVVLINLIQVNISERIREIATFKVLGFKNSEINIYIFKEIVILTIIGGIIGLPLGKIELKFVMKVIDMDMVMFPTNIYLPSYLYGFGITMLFTIITLFIFRKPLRNINMIESLKSVE